MTSQVKLSCDVEPSVYFLSRTAPSNGAANVLFGRYHRLGTSGAEI
jgi:hypothetical protein